MKDFAAIDFETANSNRSSVCSVGIVIVRNGEVVDKIHHLIRPTPNYYTWHTTEVHGMTYADTAGERSFPEVWAEIAPMVAGLPLVAHNSPFDESCLRAAHAHYEMAYPDYEFLCTLRTARNAQLGLTDYQLPTVAAHCGYNLENHHHALADAEACAEIAIQIL